MSFILDALKKSERERALGSIPTLDTVHPAHSRHGFWPRLALGLMILAIGVGVALLLLQPRWFRGPVPKAVSPKPPAAAPRTAVVKPAAPAAVNEPQPAAPAVPSRETDVDAAAAPASPPAAVGKSAAEGPPPPLSELPAAIQQSLPAMTLNVVSYSDNPARRFVMINLVRYTEGSVVTGGATVTRITPEGVVLDYRGTRFMLRP
jgi:general secretion pathway protein B